MKILFSPSEAKSLKIGEKPLHVDSFCFPELFDKRLEVINKFEEYKATCSIKELEKIFGIKDEKECLTLKNINLLDSSTCKAIERYTGVAYKYLDFNNLDLKSQEWINESVIIFSNLFGPIKPFDTIPYYKLKQGSSIGDFKPEKFYKEFFSDILDTYLKDELILDLRAGFYEKFYKIKKPYITLKFIKNGKVVSHWAKAYRGIILKHLSFHTINSISEFQNIDFPDLKIVEIIQSKLKNEYIYEITV